MGGRRLTTADKEMICRGVLIDGLSKQAARKLHPDFKSKDAREYSWETVDRTIKRFESLSPEEAAHTLIDPDLCNYYQQEHNVNLETLLPIDEEHEAALSRFISALRKRVEGDTPEKVKQEVASQKTAEWIAKKASSLMDTYLSPFVVSATWENLSLRRNPIHFAVGEHYPLLQDKHDAWALARHDLYRALTRGEANPVLEAEVYERTKREYDGYLGDLLRAPITGACGMPCCQSRDNTSV